MDWLTKMNDALNYIEENLTNDIDYDEIAKKACTSSYNFQRMFGFITETTLAEYIRRRRLTQAAFELKNSSKKVIDIAFEYGYNSATSFTRAFTALHGISPSQARQSGARLKAYPKISFQISIKGECEMDYRIDKKESFDVFGIETVIPLSNDTEGITPAQLWQKCHENGEYERLFENAGSLPTFLSQDLCKVHGIENYQAVKENAYTYMLFAFVSSDSKTDGYKKVHIPEQTYAVFTSDKFSWEEDFSQVLSSLQKRFYTEWLPTSKFKRADGANLEIYGGTPDYGYIELWYPIEID